MYKLRVKAGHTIRKGDFVVLEWDEKKEQWFAVKFDSELHMGPSGVATRDSGQTIVDDYV